MSIVHGLPSNKKINKKAEEYFRRINSSKKREYATGYWNWLLGTHQRPPEPTCSLNAAGAIKTTLDVMVGVTVKCGNCVSGFDGVCYTRAGDNFGQETEIGDNGFCINWERKGGK